MTAIKRGDVVLVAFPFTDLTTSKMRPALVISSNSFHRSGLDVILAGITSQTGKYPRSSDILLSIEDQNRAGLQKTSWVRLGKMVTLDRRLIRGKLGEIPDSTLAQLTMVLHSILSPDQRDEPQYSAQEPPAVYAVGRYKIKKPAVKRTRKRK
jgi:mRNA interferase MazF